MVRLLITDKQLPVLVRAENRKWQKTAMVEMGDSYWVPPVILKKHKWTESAQKHKHFSLIGKRESRLVQCSQRSPCPATKQKQHTNDTSFHATHEKGQSKHKKFSSLYAVTKSHLWVLLRDRSTTPQVYLSYRHKEILKKHLFEE